MGTYKIYDGSNWVDPCVNPITIVSSQNTGTINKPVFTQEVVDPFSKSVKYYNGTSWQYMSCCQYCGMHFFKHSGNAGIEYREMCIDAGVKYVEIFLNTELNLGGGLFVGDFSAAQILSHDKSTLLAQTGFFGTNHQVDGIHPPFETYIPPTIGDYTVNTLTIPDVGPATTGTLLVHVTANEFPLYDSSTGGPLHNFDVNTFPISIDPGDHAQKQRKLTYVRSNPNKAEKVWVAIFTNPTPIVIDTFAGYFDYTVKPSVCHYTDFVPGRP